MMNQKLINAMMFTAGAAIGSVVTWRVLKAHYEQYVQEEMDKFVEDWKGRMQHPNIPSDDKWDDFEDEDFDEGDDDEDEGFNESEVYDYHLLAKKYGTPGSDAENDGEGEGDEVPYVNGPVVISPDDFGDGNFDHALKGLTYYSDGVLANDWYEVFNVDETIGEEALKHFGDYAEDVVHVRNEQDAVDYEVVRDPRTFEEVIADDPLMANYAT